MHVCLEGIWDGKPHERREVLGREGQPTKLEKGPGKAAEQRQTLATRARLQLVLMTAGRREHQVDNTPDRGKRSGIARTSGRQKPALLHTRLSKC
eukprot:4396754-Amphidinium_carterae.1